MIVLRPWVPPRCPRCGRRPIVAEVVDDDTGAPVGSFCQPCGVAMLHEAQDRAAQQAREARWTKPDRRVGA